MCIRDRAYTLELLIPPTPLLENFCKLADTFEQQATLLQGLVLNLRSTRDLLLPRLLSGLIKLKES